MELYLLNENFTNRALIENYNSLVWTERFNKVGDFRLDILYSPEIRRSLQKGRYLGLRRSNRVMQIESITDRMNEDGEHILKLSGRSLEKILTTRTAWRNRMALGEDNPWTVSDIPKNIVDWALARATYSPDEAEETIGYYHTGSLYDEGNIPPYSEVINYTNLKPMSALAYITPLCEAYRVGFRIYRDPVLDRIYVETYSGNDRTTNQTVHNPVIFSAELENIDEVEILESQEALINRVQVYSKHGYSEVFREDVAGGWDYRSIAIEVQEPEELETDAQRNDYRIEKGLEELLNHDYVELMDCKVSDTQGYIYGFDYELGDLVDVQGHTGDVNRSRVTEQIFVSDQNGERSYPTLETEMLIKRNSWAGTDPAETWLGAVGTWADRT